MDSREHGASSSSPSGSLTVVEATAESGVASQNRGTGPGKTRVLLSDGSSFFVRASMWMESGLREGDAVIYGDLEQLEIRSLSVDAYEHGLRLLGRREHCRAELERKLLIKDYPVAAVEAAASRLSEHGYLDDLRFSRIFIEQRLRKRPEAPAALRSRLLDRGVDEKIISAAIDAVAAAQPELVRGAVDAAAAKLSRKSGMSDDKLARSLARRGFRTSEIIDALKALGRSGEIFPKRQELS